MYSLVYLGRLCSLAVLSALLICASACSSASDEPPALSGCTVSTVAGTAGTTGFAEGTGAAARFQFLTGIALAPDGNFYVTDGENHRIRRVTPAGEVTTVAGTGASGNTDGSLTAARLTQPRAIAAAPDGSLYVADGSAIRHIVLTGPSPGVTTLAGRVNADGFTDATGADARFNFPTGIALASDGNLYVTDLRNSSVRRVTPTGVVSTVTGNGLSGGADGSLTTATFSIVNGIAAAPDGSLYVLDRHAIRRVVLTGPSAGVTTLAGASGVPALVDGTGTAARFGGPQGIAIAADGSLYVADSENSSIRRVTPAGVVTTVAGSRTSGSADGTGAAAQFGQPYGIAIAADGRVYINDAGNSTIRRMACP